MRRGGGAAAGCGGTRAAGRGEGRTGWLHVLAAASSTPPAHPALSSAPVSVCAAQRLCAPPPSIAANRLCPPRLPPPLGRVPAAGARLAKRLVQQWATVYTPSGAAARQLRMDPRILGRITGNMWVSDGETRVDLGLAVKNAKQMTCVPGEWGPGAGGEACPADGDACPAGHGSAATTVVAAGMRAVWGGGSGGKWVQTTCLPVWGGASCPRGVSPVGVGAGFCSPLEGGKGWSYSRQLVEVVGAYRAAHGWVFDALARWAGARFGCCLGWGGGGGPGFGVSQRLSGADGGGRGGWQTAGHGRSCRAPGCRCAAPNAAPPPGRSNDADDGGGKLSLAGMLPSLEPGARRDKVSRLPHLCCSVQQVANSACPPPPLHTPPPPRPPLAHAPLTMTSRAWCRGVWHPPPNPRALPPAAA